MIDVKFKAVSPGACQWCGKERDQVYDVAFSDQSFVGKLCKTDLLRAIGLKVGRPDGDRKQPPSPATNAAPATK